MKVNKKSIFRILTVVIVFGMMFSIVKYNDINFSKDTVQTNAASKLSNKKICWGIKRNPNHQQPDVGAANKKLLDKYNGICLGDSESKKVYLTFDSRI